MVRPGFCRIRLKADIFTLTATIFPAPSLSEPGELIVAGLPTLRIASVAVADAPVSSTGYADITLPADTPLTRSPVILKPLASLSEILWS